MASEPKKKKTPARYSMQTVSLSCSEEQKRTYFKDLYALYNESKWENLPKWDKAEFFRLWFIAVSETYMRGYLELEIIIEEDRETKEITKSPLYENLDEMMGNNKMPYEYKLPFESIGRKYHLCDKWREDPRMQDNESPIFKHSQVEPLPPVKQTSIETVHADMTEFKKVSQCNELGLLYINYQYPLPELIKEISKIIFKEKDKLFALSPQEMQTFKKAYRYKEFDRYLKIYMLRQMGETVNDLIMENFYKSSNLESAERQIKKATRKAKTLSVNALSLDFPGKY